MWFVGVERVYQRAGPAPSQLRPKEWLAQRKATVRREVTETFGARARWNGTRIGVSRHSWVDIDETDQ